MSFLVLFLLVTIVRGDKLESPVSPVNAALSGGHEGDIAPPHEDLTAAASSKDAVILSYESSPNAGDGAYSFRFETSDMVNRAEEGELKNEVPEGPGEVVKGSYSYVGDDGVTYSVNYVADENGFQPIGAHLPTPHPEIVAALAQNKVEEENTATAAPEGASPANFKYNPYYYTRSQYATPVPPVVAPVSQELLAPDRVAAPVVLPAVDSTVFLRNDPQYYTKTHVTPAPVVSQEVVAQGPAVVLADPLHKVLVDKSPAIFYKTNPSYYTKFQYATPAPLVSQEVVPQEPAVVSVTPVADPVHRVAVDAARPSAIFYKANPSYYTKVEQATPAPIAQIGYFKHYPAYDYNRQYYYKQNPTLKYNNQEHLQLYNRYKNKYSYAFGTRYQY